MLFFLFYISKVKKTNLYLQLLKIFEMNNGLIIYSSTDGHTKYIAEYICSNLKNSMNYKIVSLKEANDLNLNNINSIIIGASIRYGKYQDELYQFINNNNHFLNSIKSSFFSVNAVARKVDKNTIQTNPYILKFFKKTIWTPNITAVFAGRIDYQKYSFFDKHIIRFIMWLTKGPTDLSNPHEFTDWKVVDSFVTALIKEQ